MFYSKTYRFHQAATGRGAVAGVHINMLTPEALWAVIGVAITLDRGTTLRAGEIFNVALEFFVQVESSSTCFFATTVVFIGHL